MNQVGVVPLTICRSWVSNSHPLGLVPDYVRQIDERDYQFNAKQFPSAHLPARPLERQPKEVL
jgi:hypothetical protein